ATRTSVCFSESGGGPFLRRALAATDARPARGACTVSDGPESGLDALQSQRFREQRGMSEGQ
ncbi:MAG: hypothetical protein Q8K17_01430, partial [Pseudohongiella sp.]|nr:hypothetical protein [Pseudohongiella sp.]